MASELEEDLRDCLKATEGGRRLHAQEPALKPELSESVSSALCTRPLLLLLLGILSQAQFKECGYENAKLWAHATQRRQVDGVPYVPGMLHTLFWRI